MAHRRCLQAEISAGQAGDRREGHSLPEPNNIGLCQNQPNGTHSFFHSRIRDMPGNVKEDRLATISYPDYADESNLLCR